MLKFKRIARRFLGRPLCGGARGKGVIYGILRICPSRRWDYRSAMNPGLSDRCGVARRGWGYRLALGAVFGLVAAASSIPVWADPLTERAVLLHDRGEAMERQAGRILAALRENTELEIIRKRNALNRVSDRWRDNAEAVSGAEFQEKLEQALLVGAASGLDVARMRALYESMKRSILTADLAIPGAKASNPAHAAPEGWAAVRAFFDWTGRQGAELAEAEAERQEFRLSLYRRAARLFLECLNEPDAARAHDRFRAFRAALQDFQTADALALHAEADAVVATQKLVADVVSVIPVAGEVFDVVALARGETLAGERMGTFETVVTGLFLLPAGADLLQVVRRSPNAMNVLGNVAAGIDAATPEVLRSLAKTTRSTPEHLRALATRIRGVPGAREVANRQSRLALMVQAEQAAARAARSEAGQGAARAWKAAEDEAQRLVGELGEQLTRAGDTVTPEVLAAYQRVRSHNLAVKGAQNADFDTLRGPLFDLEARLFGTVDNVGGRIVNRGDGLVDRQAMAELSERIGEGLRAAAKGDAANEPANRIVAEIRHAALKGEDAASAARAADFDIARHVDPDNLRIEVFNATNEVPKRGKIGTDRDITYQLVLKDGSRIDIPAAVVEEPYYRALFQTLNPGRPPPAEGFAAWGKRMDHAVTDGMHREAYRVHGGKIEDVLGRNPARLSSSGAESVGDTFVDKGLHWLDYADEAARAGDMPLALMRQGEAMRQIVKQYDNIVLPRLAREGLDAAGVLDPKLQAALAMFRRIGDPVVEGAEKVGRTYSPADAEAALRAMGLDTRTVFHRVAEILPALETLRP